MKNIIEALKPYSSTLDAEQFSDIQTLIEGLDGNLKAVREQGRNLRIAVVGQMKAGKSSFLNAAIFEQDLLPKADIPMTAALTKIVYAPKAKAEVVFYNEDDWNGIERRAAEYPAAYAEAERKLTEMNSPEQAGGFASPFAKLNKGFNKALGITQKPTPEQIIQRIPDIIKSSKELVERAQKQKLDVKKYLGKTEVIENIDGAANIAKALQNYVGSDGHFTAITKMSILHVDDPRLEGLEIIDTPGFNDPVVSRGQVTRSFLGQCDVIFLLSSASQFLTASDMSVLREQLTEAGISEKAVFLIASQRDMAMQQSQSIIDRAQKYATTHAKSPEQHKALCAKAMMEYLDQDLNKLAHDTLNRHINSPHLDDKTRSILNAVRESNPCSVSSWAWMTAANFNKLSKDDTFSLNQLNRVTSYQFNPDALKLLSNIPKVRDNLLAQKERKAQLIASKEQSLIDGVNLGVRERLTAICTELDTRQERIQNSNIQALENTENDMLERMNKGRAKLEDVFDEQLVKASQAFELLKKEMRSHSQRYKVSEQKSVETESYEKSTSRWWNPFSWGDSETRYREVVTIYASAQDAIEQVEEFAQNTAISLQRAIIDCVDLDSLRRKVSSAAMNLFDTGDANFDAELMLTEVNKSLRRLTIPNTDFGDKDYGQMISRSFGSGRVSEYQINGLRDAQREALTTILSDLGREVDNKVNAISESLKNTSNTFVNDMTKDIQAGLKKLREDIKNREKSLQEINEARNAVQGILANC